MPRRTGIFAKLNLRDQDTFLDITPRGLVGENFVDNPDGCIGPDGLGCYSVGPERGRTFSQGAGTEKGGIGNASGMGKTLKLKDDAF